MAKEEKFSFKKILGQFMEKSLQSIIAVVADQSDHIVSWIKDISGLKRKIKKILTAVIILSAGLMVVGVGLGIFIGSLYPNLDNGISHILVGLAFVLVAIIYLKVVD